MQTQNRTTPVCVSYLDASPCHTARGPGAERLHRGFLSCEACGKALDRILLALAITNLVMGKHAPKKAITKARNRLRDARNFTYVHSGANDHAVISTQRPGGCATRAT